MNTLLARRSSFVLAAVSMLAALPGQQSDAVRQRPNIVLIVSDDHAAHAVSAYDDRLDRTPCLDRLATEGMRFDRALVSNSLCGPSRATILTGRYSHAHGFTRNEQRFDGSQWTLPQALQDAGYQTAVIGKWHLGSEPTGCDHWCVLPGQGRYVDPVFVTAAGRQAEDGYVTDRITDHALAWLAQRDPARPFFLWVGHKAPHREWTPPPDLAAQYRERTFAEPATLFDDWATRSAAGRDSAMSIARHLTRTDVKQDPPPDLAGDDLTRWYLQRYLQDYLACAQSMDRNVGRLLDWLAAHDLTRDTLVVYTSDNGFFLGDHGLYDKRFMYEESLRVPLLVRWPGVIAGGSTSAALVGNQDLAPTLLAAAGVPPPGDLHGRDLAPLWQPGEPPAWRTSFYYRYYEHLVVHGVPAHCGVRTATHKLIWFPSLAAFELFDLRADPHELRNLAGDAAHADLLAELQGELRRLQAELGDPDPLR